MLVSHGILHVFTDLSIAVIAIQFWPLLAQLVCVSAVSNSTSNDSAGSTLTPSSARLEFGTSQQMLWAPPPLPQPLMEKALTHCGGEDNTNWRPVCATANNVDYVLFASECLLWQTNRERHDLDTGEARPVFRKIALGFCQPNCSIVICVHNEQMICARNLQNDEIRAFHGDDCDVVRDICLHGNDWQRITESACAMKADSLPSISTSTSPTKATVPSLVTKNTKITEHAHTQATKLTKKQIKKSTRKAIPCPKVFNPVCAELFGVKATFINECLVNAENVNFGKTWQIFSEGVCAEDYASSETHKNVINKRSTVDMAVVTYQLNPSENKLVGNTSWTQNTRYIPESILSLYGEKVHQHPQASQLYGFAQLSMQTTPQYMRILPVVDDHVTICKFGAAPICGSSAKYTTHSFENICELLLRNIILDESWSVINEGKCKRCVLNCPTEYEPICVSRNGLNYTIINQCHLDYAICRNKQSVFKILGKGECSSVLKNIGQNRYEFLVGYANQNGTIKEFLTSTPRPTPHEVYSPRHARKILESSQLNRIHNSYPDAYDLKSTKAPVEFVVVQKPSSEISDKKTVEYMNSKDNSLTSRAAKEPAATKSHIMNLWRSSKKRKSRVAKNK